VANVLFVCRANAGRSQMSQALLERVAGDRHEARSAGSEADPTGSVHTPVVEVMRELGIDLAGRRPHRLDRADAERDAQRRRARHRCDERARRHASSNSARSLCASVGDGTMDGAVQPDMKPAAEIRRAIADGEAAPGERLPPAKDIAAALGVNRNTVLTALRMLRDEGLVDFRRGRGVIVAGTPARSEVVEHARALVRFARSRGYERDELVQIIRSVS
jgi:GntR family transcriptional regulator